ncbi:Rne/Rng family ribonuclease [Desnuesiella massiliensis]|uniref:Rne/Rng family ribonuclease n=1 Tax=Desnuesiella massiliensis TaxID=1650662 RepID=UPI0006E352BC|nr:ribonuclease E/G [Desnuesiella massiliensis]
MREIFIERGNKLLRIAIKEKEKLVECYIEEDSNEPFPGEIYKGVVKNIVPAIKCAFVDIGHEKNAYMYIDKKYNNVKLKKGEEVLVEVVKEELGNKGAKVNNFITLPGRFVVLTNENTNISFSKKIEDDAFKGYIESNIKKPENIGILLRTNAMEAELETINKEIEELYEVYKDIYDKWKYSLKPKKLYGEGSIIYKILRDSVTTETKKILVDSLEDYNIVKDFIDHKLNAEVHVELYEGHRNLFDYYGIEKEILSLRSHKISLNCGGYITIDKTEAMHVVDVNSGKNTSSKSMEKTAFITNAEAAAEISRQIRLRNLSGIIVIDFIDLNIDEDKNKIMEILKEGFAEDKNKTVIYPFTQLNLVQIARRRRGKTIYDYIEEPCMECRGIGKRLKLSYISLLIRNEILKVNSGDTIKDIYIEINPMYKEFIEGNLLEFLSSIGALDKNVYISYLSNTEYFKVEPLIFHSQIENLKGYKVWSKDSI